MSKNISTESLWLKLQIYLSEEFAKEREDFVFDPEEIAKSIVLL